MKSNFDSAHIQRAMQALACAKPDLAELMRRGAAVTYVLERQSGERIVQNITCAAPR